GLQRQGEPRRGRHVADRLRAEGVDRRRRGKDCRAREESGELRTELAIRPRPLVRRTPADRTPSGALGNGKEVQNGTSDLETKRKLKGRPRLQLSAPSVGGSHRQSAHSWRRLFEFQAVLLQQSTSR